MAREPKKIDKEYMRSRPGCENNLGILKCGAGLFLLRIKRDAALAMSACAGEANCNDEEFDVPSWPDDQNFTCSSLRGGGPLLLYSNASANRPMCLLKIKETCVHCHVPLAGLQNIHHMEAMRSSPLPFPTSKHPHTKSYVPAPEYTRVLDYAFPILRTTKGVKTAAISVHVSLARKNRISFEEMCDRSDWI